MKKYSNKLIIMILSVVMLFSLAIGVGCDCGGGSSSDGDGNVWIPIEKKASITLNKSSEKLIVGDYLTVVATTNKVLEESVVFESENESVATVTERGQIEAINAGTTNIVAKYGNATAKCSITVEWDETYPVLIDVDGLENSYVVYKDSSFEFRPAIKYRGRTYYDAEFNYVSTNEDVATFDGYVLKTSATAAIGSVANCYVEASWRGFDASSAPLLRSDFTVEIKKEAYITLKGTSEDFIELYTREEFEGKNYVKSSALIPEFYVEGEKVEREFNIEILDSTLATYENNEVIAKKYGKTEIVISCEYEGQNYGKSITVEVERPIADYKDEIGKFSSDIGLHKDANDDFASKTIAETIYGTNDVTIIEAFQDYARLVVEDNKILGVTGIRDDVYHTVITIGTETEIYNVGLEVYGLYITEMEDFHFFTDSPSANNYYYLANDIDATGFDFKCTKTCTCATGLLGIFEGNGHVISNLTNKTCGLFGVVNGGTVQNLAITNVKLSGYYPGVLGHKESGKVTLKNIYVEIDSVATRGGGLYQQTMSSTGTHENIVVVYGISQDAVRTVMSKTGNDGNISTFSPNRATLYKDGVFKNCFSVSYAPVGCSSPLGTDFSWTSHMMAENQVNLGDADADGNIPLTGVTDWDKELLAATTPADFLKVKASTTADATNNTGTDVLKGVKAYPTLADLASDKAQNAEILATFDKNYWTVIDGIPYWSALYVKDLNIVLRTNDNNVYDSTTLTENETELTISLEDGSQSYTNISIEVPDCFELNGRTIRLKEMPTRPKYQEIVITGIINNISVERVLTIFVTPEGKEVDETIAYSYDDKELDFKLLNDILDLSGEDAITKDNIECYYIGGDTVEYTGELILPVKVAYDRSSVEELDITIIANGKLYMLNSVMAYTKIIDEGEDLKYFTLKGENEYNKVDGYFIVTRDIDASEVVFDAHVLHSGTIYPGSKDMGFVGVFDGQGHVIKNVHAKSNGIFGNVMSGIIKNVAFTGVTTSGQYPALFAHNSNRGKDEAGNFTNIETELSNVYVQVDSVGGNGGLLFNNQTTPTSRFKNVVVEFLGFNDNEDSTEMGWIKKGSRFSVLGGVTFEYFTATANYKDIYKNCFAITKAPLDVNGTCYHFGENQFDYTLNEKGGVASATAIDPFVTQVLGYKGKTVIPSNVSLGVKAYDTYADMAADAAANKEWLATFNTDLWIVVNDVPYWKSVYANSFGVSIKNGDVPVEDKIILTNDTTELTISIVDANGIPVTTTITDVEGLVVNGNKVKLAEVPTSKGSYEVVATATVNGVVIERVVTINYSNEIEVVDKVLYSDDDNSLDLDSLNKALIAVDAEPIALSDIDSYKVNGEEVDVLDLDVIVSNNTNINQGRNRSVDVAQEVILIVKGKTVVLNNVYAYTKIIDEAEDLKFFTMNYRNAYNEIDGYFVLTKNIDASNLELEDHKFEANKNAASPVPYPSAGISSDIGLRGVFDGQGYTIDGLTTKSTGLFANANAPVIKNVAFTNVSLTGYYPTLFAQNIVRGKDYDNSFNGYEGLISNVYVSIKSIEKGSAGRVGILVSQVLPAAVSLKNVIVEYSNVSDEIQGTIDAGKAFYMFGSSGNTMANSTASYKDCYAVSTAPVLQLKKMPGFAQNQVEYTLTGTKVTAVGNVLDPQVTEVLNRCDKTLTIDYVLVGLKAYDDYAAMKAANNDYASFSADYWTIVDGVPTWNN